MSRTRLSMLLFLASESVFFIFLLVAFVTFRIGPGHGDMTDDLNLFRTSIFTACLVASSFTAWRAELHSKQKNGKRFHYWLTATLLLGAVFLYGQLSEYFELFKKEITVSHDPLSTAFFTVTGFHGLHVCVGILLLAMLLVWSFWQRKSGRTVPHSAVESISLYWHFVDIVWVAVFSVIYIFGTR